MSTTTATPDCPCGITHPTDGPPTFFFDGWYADREWADGVADWVRTFPDVVTARVIRSGDSDSYAVLYIARGEHLDNHAAGQWLHL